MNTIQTRLVYSNDKLTTRPTTNILVTIPYSFTQLPKSKVQILLGELAKASVWGLLSWISSHTLAQSTNSFDKSIKLLCIDWIFDNNIQNINPFDKLMRITCVEWIFENSNVIILINEGTKYESHTSTNRVQIQSTS